MLRRLAQVLLAGGLLAMGVLALVSAVRAEPEAGVTVDDATGLVSQVDPGSPVWRSGIRIGDRVLQLHDALDPGGWRIATANGSMVRESFADGHLARLRHYIPWSVLALGAAFVGALLAYRGVPAAAAVVPLALGATAEPLFYAGNFAASVVAGATVFGGAAVALLVFPRWRRRLAAAVAAAIGLGVFWVLASTAVPAAFDAADALRTPSVLGLSMAGMVAVGDRKRLAQIMTGKGGPAFIDLAYLSTVGVIIAAAAALGWVAIEWIAIGAVIAIAVYPFWRRSAFAAFERFVTARARRDASIKAVEDERGRLAREIHDASLQELASVIRRLESIPGADAETSSLRSVAEGLRDVATSLHPPVLQDLGLAAAIADLGDHVSEAHPGWSVVVDVDDVTLADRPPADVELAAFRVIQEALANAIAHSQGHTLEIGGVVSTDAIDLRADDDGHGFHAEAAREARRGGHFGLDAMRERAEAVGGRVLVTPGATGVSVRFQWERR